MRRKTEEWKHFVPEIVLGKKDKESQSQLVKENCRFKGLFFPFRFHCSFLFLLIVSRQAPLYVWESTQPPTNHVFFFFLVCVNRITIIDDDDQKCVMFSVF